MWLLLLACSPPVFAPDSSPSTESDADADSDADTDTDADADIASFSAEGQGGPTHLYEWSSSGGNLISCVNEGGAEGVVRVRLAEQTTNNGVDGPHLDLRVCHFNGAGSYAPVDPTQACPPGRAFGLSWYPEGTDPVYVSGAADCTLDLDDSQGLNGSFTCLAGVWTLSDGSFACGTLD